MILIFQAFRWILQHKHDYFSVVNGKYKRLEKDENFEYILPIESGEPFYSEDLYDIKNWFKQWGI